MEQMINLFFLNNALKCGCLSLVYKFRQKLNTHSVWSGFSFASVN